MIISMIFLPIHHAYLWFRQVEERNSLEGIPPGDPGQVHLDRLFCTGHAQSVLPLTLARGLGKKQSPEGRPSLQKFDASN